MRGSKGWESLLRKGWRVDDVDIDYILPEHQSHGFHCCCWSMSRLVSAGIATAGYHPAVRPRLAAASSEGIANQRCHHRHSDQPSALMQDFPASCFRLVNSA